MNHAHSVYTPPALKEVYGILHKLYSKNIANSCVFIFIWCPQKIDSLEYSMFVKMENMTDTLTSLEHRLHSLTEQSTKLERLMLHFAQEQEKYLELARPDSLLKGRSLFHSQPSSLHSRNAESERELKGSEDSYPQQDNEDSTVV